MKTKLLFPILFLSIFIPVFAFAQFSSDLKPGDIGEEVRMLQKVLNSLGKTIAPAPQPGSKGYETNYFGSATASALKSLQC